MRKISGIYKITNILNLKFYVGRSSNVVRRLKQHLWDLKANRHHNPKLQNSFNKYGESCFLFEIACETEEENTVELEQLAIDEGILTGRCFNINTDARHGGVVGRIWTPEQIENIKRGQEKSSLFAKTSLKNQTTAQRQRALALAHTTEAKAKAVLTRKQKGFDCRHNFRENQERRSIESISRTLKAIEWVMETKETMTKANKLFGISQKMWVKVIPLWEESTGRVFDLPKKACGYKNRKFRGEVIANGVIYASLTDASSSTGIPYSTLVRWCSNNLNGWSYKSKENKCRI